MKKIFALIVLAVMIFSSSGLQVQSGVGSGTVVQIPKVSASTSGTICGIAAGSFMTGLGSALSSAISPTSEKSEKAGGNSSSDGYGGNYLKGKFVVQETSDGDLGIMYVAPNGYKDWVYSPDADGKITKAYLKNNGIPGKEDIRPTNSHPDGVVFNHAVIFRKNGLIEEILLMYLSGINDAHHRTRWSELDSSNSPKITRRSEIEKVEVPYKKGKTKIEACERYKYGLTIPRVAGDMKAITDYKSALAFLQGKETVSGAGIEILPMEYDKIAEVKLESSKAIYFYALKGDSNCVVETYAADTVARTVAANLPIDELQYVDCRDRQYAFFGKSGNRFCLTDATGSKISYFDAAPTFVKGDNYVMILKRDGKQGVIDMQQNTILPFDYDSISQYEFDRQLFHNYKLPTALQVQQGNRYGLMDISGQVLMPIEYTQQVFVTLALLYPQNSFSVFFHNHYSIDRKGEFETQADFEKRQNDPELKQSYEKNILATAESEFIARATSSSKQSPATFILYPYNADKQQFIFGNSAIPGVGYSLMVPISEAPAFKVAFDEIKTAATKTAKFFILDDFIALGTVTFTMPDGKTYTYTHPRYKDYKGATIINFKLQ